MKKTPVGENAAQTVKMLLEHNTLNLKRFFRKEASIDACE